MYTLYICATVKRIVRFSGIGMILCFPWREKFLEIPRFANPPYTKRVMYQYYGWQTVCEAFSVPRHPVRTELDWIQKSASCSSRMWMSNPRHVWTVCPAKNHPSLGDGRKRGSKRASEIRTPLPTHEWAKIGGNLCAAYGQLLTRLFSRVSAFVAFNAFIYFSL